MTALKIIEVTPDMADAFMGASELDEGGAVLLPRSREHDTGTRTVLFTDIVGSTSLTQRLGDRTNRVLYRRKVGLPEQSAAGVISRNFIRKLLRLFLGRGDINKSDQTFL